MRTIFRLLIFSGAFCSITITTSFADTFDLVCSTYLGGSGRDWGYGIAIDNSGNMYVVGQTESYNFPVKEGT